MPEQFDPDFPTRYRKLPVTVEAIRYTPGTNCAAVAQFLGDDPDDLTCAEEADHEQTEYAIATLEGVMHASPGDYIIRGVHGEFYPSRGDIFEATYERCAPSEDELAKAVTSGWVEGFDEFGKYGPQFDSALAARAVLALFEGVGR